ncbi:MAG: methylmalonyl-CoA epimerase [Desulfurococcales archaeon]|nr:methylmalonyl-CoA epimerase [Desulfurococcales archaeon]
MKLDHLGIAVKNLDEAVRFYKDVLGLELIEREEVPEERVRIAIFKVGDVFIELLEGTSEDSAISRFVSKRGEGIHHLAIRVDDVEEVSKRLRERGVPLVYDVPKLVAGGKRKINFIHPKATHGVLLEILERCGE